MTRILVVANRTAAAPQLLEEIRRRRDAGPCEFALLIPDVQDRKAADWTLETALPLMRTQGGRPGEGPGRRARTRSRRCRTRCATARYDEIIVSTLPRKTSKWLRRDLIRQIEDLGVPVTAITPGGGMSNKKAAKAMLELGTGPFGGP